MAHIVHIPILVIMTFFLEFTFYTKKVPEVGNLSFHCMLSSQELAMGF